MANISYGDLKFDSAEMPEASVNALLSRGLTHLFGSEASSKLIGKIRAAHKAEALANGTKAEDYEELSKEAVKAWREANPDQISAWAQEIQAEYVKAIAEGTLGTRVGGTRLDPLEKEIEDQAKAWVRTMLSAHDVKPSQYAKGKAVTLAGREWTFDEMVEARIKRDRENLEKAARKALADKARKAEKAKEAAKSAATAEDIGL